MLRQRDDGIGTEHSQANQLDDLGGTETSIPDKNEERERVLQRAYTIQMPEVIKAAKHATKQKKPPSQGTSELQGRMVGDRCRITVQQGHAH